MTLAAEHIPIGAPILFTLGGIAVWFAWARRWYRGDRASVIRGFVDQQMSWTPLADRDAVERKLRRTLAILSPVLTIGYLVGTIVLTGRRSSNHRTARPSADRARSFCVVAGQPS